MPDNEFYDSDEGEAQGTMQNLSSRHYQNYQEQDIEYDGDESEGNRVNGKAGTTRASSSSTVEEPSKITDDEARQIEEALLAERVKSEPKEGNEPIGESTSSAMDVHMKDSQEATAFSATAAVGSGKSRIF